MKDINKELVEQWVEALRSGKYKQGRRTLRNRNDEFCCLGVLPDKVWEYLGREAVDYKVHVSTVNSKIPISVVESFLLPLKEIHLITLNDVYKLSFEQIADILEEEFLK